MQDILSVVLAAILGGCIGSFLHLCCERIPKAQSIVYPGSHCSHCSRLIAWYRNIPIISYLMLKGRSHCCGQPMGASYWVFEVLFMLIFGLAFYMLPVLYAVWISVFFALLIPGLVIDARHLWIPDRFTLGGILVGASLWSYVGGIEALMGSIGDASLAAGVLFLFASYAECCFKREAFGLGDVKLGAFIASFWGLKCALMSVVLGAILALMYFGGRFILERIRRQPTQPMLGVEIPFGPWMGLGTCFWLCNEVFLSFIFGTF